MEGETFTMEETHTKNLIMHITTENFTSPAIQVRNGNIFCNANNLSNEPGLVYQRGRFEQTRIEINQQNSMETTSKGMSDIIFLDNVSRFDLLKRLQRCHHPVQGFYLDIHSDPEESFPVPVTTSPMQFTENAIVEVHRVDFREPSFKTIIEGIQTCEILGKVVFYSCTYIPKTLVDTLGKIRNLSVLQIERCRLSDELSQLLCDQVRHWENLQILSLADSLSPSMDTGPLLSSLARHPLRILDLNSSKLTGKIGKAWNVSGTNFSNLEKLFLDDTGVNRRDLSTIARLISEKKMPELQDLSLLSIDFKEHSHSLSELLKSCDDNLAFCTVWVTSTKLPRQFNQDKFQCLRSPRENVSYDYGFNYSYFEGEEVEMVFDYEHVAGSPFSVNRKSTICKPSKDTKEKQVANSGNVTS